MRSVGIKLKSTLGLIFFNALLHQLNIAIKSRQKYVIYRHQRKCCTLQTKQKRRISDINHIRVLTIKL